ncbi:pentapeptide repeat-containing protein [Streptomyces cyaneofuscatus]|uniref:pentapeptide repeat-containing protein n=1 Tax=Streptomyces cyaneofuscatus TaxID=66883 RepID=UPI003668B041
MRFTLAQLTHADLAGAVLNGADLTYAVLNSADRTGASMIGTRLDHTDLTQTVGLTEEQIVLTVPSRSVMLPEWMERSDVVRAWRRGTT